MGPSYAEPVIRNVLTSSPMALASDTKSRLWVTRSRNGSSGKRFRSGFVLLHSAEPSGENWWYPSAVSTRNSENLRPSHRSSPRSADGVVVFTRAQPLQARFPHAVCGRTRLAAGAAVFDIGLHSVFLVGGAGIAACRTNAPGGRCDGNEQTQRPRGLFVFVCDITGLVPQGAQIGSHFFSSRLHRVHKPSSGPTENSGSPNFSVGTSIALASEIKRPLCGLPLACKVRPVLKAPLAPPASTTG